MFKVRNSSGAIPGRASLLLSTKLNFKSSRLSSVSTLFPYTTLFRSHVARRLAILGVELDHDVVQFVVARERADPAAAEERQTDRKSTRLNSSHVKISYAVFCLKKKNRYVGGKQF